MTHSRETYALTTVLLANGKNGGRFLAVPVSCPMCESSNVEMLGHTDSQAGGRSIGAVLRCMDCQAEEVLGVHLEPFTRARQGLKDGIFAAAAAERVFVPTHGEERGYKWHMNHDRDPCDACRKAHRDYKRRERGTAPDGLAVAS